MFKFIYYVESIVMREAIRNLVFYKLYKKIRSRISAIAWGNPAENMIVIGITGTDGKTTTSNLIHKIINDNLGSAVLLSTSMIRFGDKEFHNDSKMTSMDPWYMHKLLSNAKELGCKYAVLEVSSHSLDQFRFNDIEFDIGVLTNITQEHLDYHKTLDNYANSKKQLFHGIIKNKKQFKGAVLPKDSEYGRKWLEELPFEKEIDYGINTYATLRGENIKEYVDHTQFDIKYLSKIYNLDVKLLGTFNVQNMLAATGVGLIMGIPMENIVNSLLSFKPLTGRQEKLTHDGVSYFIDFAHTPNGLENILKFLKGVKGNGRLITLFGAPGNRDKYKRPIMGGIAERYSDIVIVTDDDPDTENRYDIINQVMNGISKKDGDDVYVIPERLYAIRFLTEIVKPGDIVLLAGKGHETVQLTNHGKRPWSDMNVLKENLGIL